MAKKLLISSLGYPRIGFDRQWKKCLESFWAGKIGEDQFVDRMRDIRLANLKRQQDLGVDVIPVNDFTFYDQVLDMATMFNVIPKRFGSSTGPIGLSTYFAMARGTQESVACEMTKWFDTNYHYIVPEYEKNVELRVTQNRPLEAFREAKEKLGITGKPVIIGPYSFAKMTKGDLETIENYIDLVMPLYVQILLELEAEGCEWVQMDEPFLVVTMTLEELELVKSIYQYIRTYVSRLKIMLQTYFDSLEHYREIVELPVSGVGLDFVHGYSSNMQHIMERRFPGDKVIGLGIINGRNIWRCNIAEEYRVIKQLVRVVPYDRMWIQPSCSLQFVPVSATCETNLPPILKNTIAFADEKLTELKQLSEAIETEPEKIPPAFAEANTQVQNLQQERIKLRINVDVESLSLKEIDRSEPFESRFEKQKMNLGLPILPTTTIGSFPQTAEVRSARNKWKNGTLSTQDYEKFISEQIAKWIRIQEKIGLDVLVHGEFERNDMVEYFGEKLGGFAFTTNGWIQSYGSRCVKPPIIYSDVHYSEPMTVKETVYAQSLTKKPVKGILTGPVTILNWSFVRDDIPSSEVAYQIALALRQEIAALEAAGIKLVQVDEPALREGLPLKKKESHLYLHWAVKAFRMATSRVKPETQIHTHMCYCEFQDILGKIAELDADVISIETSRSHGEMVQVFEKFKYAKGIGLGVYDIHSPRIPSKEEISDILTRGLQVVDPQVFWVNPDCGLKTRTEEQTISALKNMVQAAKEMRSKLEKS